jgi:hypothetical protein
MAAIECGSLPHGTERQRPPINWSVTLMCVFPGWWGFSVARDTLVLISEALIVLAAVIAIALLSAHV